MINTLGSIYPQVPVADNAAVDDYERLQELLLGVRRAFCGGVSADLARKISTDASYVNRLFYPRGKKGAKGIGPEVMRACREKFSLPNGFWDMTPEEAFGADGKIAGMPVAAPAAEDVTIRQYDTGGGMGRSRLLLADQPGVIKSWHVDHEWLRQNVKHYTSIENLRIVTGFGHSMRPMFNPGDPLLVDVGVKKVEQEGIFFFRIDDDGYIKTIQRIPQPGGGRLLRARSSNREEFDDFFIDETTMDFQVLAKVLTVWKSEQY